MNVEQIKVSDIEASDRLRELDPDYVEFIRLSIAEHGLRQPIEVRKVGRKYHLIAGGHRLAAVTALEWDTIPGVVLKATELEARLLEIDENLFRRELSPLDRATFLAKRKEVYEELHPEAKHGGDRKSDQVDKLGHLIASFSEVTAEKLGLSERTVRRAVHVFRAIAPDVRQKISALWIADSGSQLDTLAKQTPDMQRKIADYMVQWPAVRNVGEIVRQLENRPRPTAPEKLEKFLAFFRKCGPEEQQEIIEYAAAQMPAVACNAAWSKASEMQRQVIMEDFAPRFPGFSEKEAA